MPSSRSSSSGDLIADRRMAYAIGLAADGQFADAAELMQQALERVPGWAGGWSLLGDYAEAAGNISGALAAWRALEPLDAAGVSGVALKLGRYGAAPTRAPAGYVEALFDEFAPRFDSVLVQQLGYDVPRQLAALILAAVPRFGRALDLGCGTGLMGAHLRHAVEHLSGVDLSAAMLAEARRKQIYDRLDKADLLACLDDETPGLGLVTAADVLIYCGDPAPIIAGVMRVLAPGGLFALSVETHAGPESMQLQPSLRYAHAAEPLAAELAANGFVVMQNLPTVIRMDRGLPIAGALLLARRL